MWRLIQSQFETFIIIMFPQWRLVPAMTLTYPLYFRICSVSNKITIIYHRGTVEYLVYHCFKQKQNQGFNVQYLTNEKEIRRFVILCNGNLR